ncbi:hypothetical protein AWB78_08320 [Caballeronia calidae]|uniref:Uncharacterized protein n=1 Tax=Caballeronia calidae TaxID=1777139 RepID=A0A158EJ57_9BURK|nr:hypothetical protein [Caballeronia calidae]SAL06922.1 hypothetical protein AWB78_08320 [Caballeronia calidae]
MPKVSSTGICSANRGDTIDVGEIDSKLRAQVRPKQRALSPNNGVLSALKTPKKPQQRQTADDFLKSWAGDEFYRRSYPDLDAEYAQFCDKFDAEEKQQTSEKSSILHLPRSGGNPVSQPIVQTESHRGKRKATMHADINAKKQVLLKYCEHARNLANEAIEKQQERENQLKQAKENNRFSDAGASMLFAALTHVSDPQEQHRKCKNILFNGLSGEASNILITPRLIEEARLTEEAPVILDILKSEASIAPLSILFKENPSLKNTVMQKLSQDYGKLMPELLGNRAYLERANELFGGNGTVRGISIIARQSLEKNMRLIGNAFKDAYEKGEHSRVKTLVNFVNIAVPAMPRELRKQVHTEMHAAQKGWLFNSDAYNHLKNNNDPLYRSIRTLKNTLLK